MARKSSRLFKLFTALSCAMVILLCIAWARSGMVGDYVQCRVGLWQINLRSDWGRVVVEWLNWTNRPLGKPLDWETNVCGHHHESPGMMMNAVERAGVEYEDGVLSFRNQLGILGEYRLFRMYYPDAILPFLLLPAVALWRRHRRNRRRADGMCVHCGYDLRASKDRCPECGAALPTTPPKTLVPSS